VRERAEVQALLPGQTDGGRLNHEDHEEGTKTHEEPQAVFV